MRVFHRSSISIPLFVGLALLLVAVAVAAGAGTARAGAAHLVVIDGFAYQPAELTITVGDTVTWTNLDAVAHTATDVGGTWDTGLFDQDESRSITFTASGTYDYLCTPHPSMTGRITVLAASQTAPTPAPTAGASAPPPATTPAPYGSLPDVAMERSGRGVAIVGLGLLALAVTLTVARRPRTGDQA